jgi:uncharacterized protein (DUF433 family)
MESTHLGDLLRVHARVTLKSMSSAIAAITHDPGRRGGRACVRDLRITVADVLSWLAAGQSAEQIQQDYPELTPEDIRACLSYAASRESHEVRIAASV